jgi:hypothetical protein
MSNALARAMARYTFWDLAPDGAFEDADSGPGWARPGPWESVRLADVDLPGKCTVRSGKGRKLEVHQAQGANVEQLNDLGAETDEVLIVCQMWMPAHLERYADLVKAIEVKGGPRGKPRALKIDHPGLALLGIDSIYVTHITVPEPVGKGVMEFSVRGSEFKPATGQPALLPSGPGIATVPTAIKVGSAATSTLATPDHAAGSTLANRPRVTEVKP